MNKRLRAALDLIDSQLASTQEQKRIPGLAAGVVLDQDLIWDNGYGYANLEKQLPANADSVYRVASITKLITGTMLMQLRDSGKVNLDDPIAQYLPEFKITSNHPDARPPTFRQVAAHAAGLPREGNHKGWADTLMPTIDSLLSDLDQQEMTLPINLEPKYSNLGIAIMGHALSKIAGMPYTDYVHKYILEPLGMSSSGFDEQSIPESQFTVGYYLPSHADPFERSPYWEENGFVPAGGMYASVRDMAKFISLQFCTGDTQSDVLRAGSIREMHAPVNISQDFTMGFGISFGMRRVGGHKVIGHSGGLPGYTTNITIVPALKLGVLAFTNTGSNPIAISESMLEILMPVVAALDAPPQPSAEDINAWRKYVGKYAWMANDDGIEVKLIEGRLKIVGADGNPAGAATLVPHDEHRFKMVGGSAQGELATFTVDDDGKITGLWLSAYPFNRID